MEIGNSIGGLLVVNIVTQLSYLSESFVVSSRSMSSFMITQRMIVLSIMKVVDPLS